MQPVSVEGNRKLVVHLPSASQPWVTGGREVYTQSLARDLQALGLDNLLVYHQNPSVKEPVGSHEHNGIRIQVLPPLPEIQRDQTYACRTNEVPGFRELLNRLKPAIVHFQDFSTSANLLHLDEAKAVGARTVMTFHSPGQSCLQRELLYNGVTPCDGEIRLDRCTACRLGVQGIPTWLRWPLSKITLPQVGQSRLSRALSARTMTATFAQAFNEMVQKIDRIHVLSQWVKDVLLRNHVPGEKTVFFRSGLPLPPQDVHPRVRANNDPLQLVMVGRCEAIKGQEVLIDAVQSLPVSNRVQVSFLGPYWDTTEYGRRCLQKIKGDNRFSPPRLVPHHEIPSILSQADALVIPSTWLENAPLVVLEALAYKLPVIGSRLGGIPEMVTDGQTGLLFEVGSSVELSRCIIRLQEEEGLLESLRKNIGKPRLMKDVAIATAEMYQAVLSN